MGHRPVEITPSNLDFREYNRETLITNTQQQSCLCTTRTLGWSLFYTLELNTRLLPHHPPPAGPSHYRAQVRALGTHELNRGAQYSHPTLCWTQTSTANHARFMQCSLFPLNCIQAPKLLWQMTAAEKWCILYSQIHSTFPGLALVLVQPSFCACQEELQQAVLACLHLPSKDLPDPLSIKHKGSTGV